MQERVESAFGCLTATQRRLLHEFGKRGVRFIVIGGYAMRFYGRLRPVHDLDLVVDCAEDNIQKIKEALEAVDAIQTDEVPARLRVGAKQIVKWNDTELWPSSFSKTYECLARGAVEVRVRSTAGHVISKADLAAAKYEASRLAERDKREQDLADLEYLARP